MANLNETKVYRGVVRNILHLYKEEQSIEKIGVEIYFKTGRIKYITNKYINLCKNDFIQFKAKKIKNEWFITELLKVDRQPMRKVTLKDKQYQRLIKNI